MDRIERNFRLGPAGRVPLPGTPPDTKQVDTDQPARLARAAALLSIQQELADRLEEVTSDVGGKASDPPVETENDTAPAPEARPGAPASSPGTAEPTTPDEDTAPTSPPPRAGAASALPDASPSSPTLAGYISQKLQVWGDTAPTDAAAHTPVASSPPTTAPDSDSLPPDDTPTEPDAAFNRSATPAANATTAATQASDNASVTARNLHQAMSLQTVLHGDMHAPHELGALLAEMLHSVAPEVFADEEERLEADEEPGPSLEEGEAEESPASGATSAERSAPAATHRPSDAVIASNLESLLNRSHRQEGKSKQAAARLLLMVLKAHGAYTYEHCVRLVGLGLALAKELGYEDDELYQQIEYGVTYKDVGEIEYFMTRESPQYKQALAAYLGGLNLAQGAMLHDFGKIKVPPEILYKPGLLTPAEVHIMQQHPVWGAQILSAIPALAHAVPATRHHHERWDGRGYPDRLAGSDIPLSARIVSVVDSFDAMVADRPYRQSLSMEHAREEIVRGAGSQFDPDIAASFARVVSKVWHPD